MSTLVRKYLLGASFVWRMKQLRLAQDAVAASAQSTDATQNGVGGSLSKKTVVSADPTQRLLSQRTRNAVDRACLVAAASSPREERGEPIYPVSGSSAFDALHTGAPEEQGATGEPTTPLKNRPSATSMMNRSEIAASLPNTNRIVDGSPSAMRHAILVGDNERHGDFDHSKFPTGLPSFASLHFSTLMKGHEAGHFFDPFLRSAFTANGGGKMKMVKSNLLILFSFAQSLKLIAPALFLVLERTSPTRALFPILPVLPRLEWRQAWILFARRCASRRTRYAMLRLMRMDWL